MTRAQNQLFILGCENKGFLAEVKEIHQKAAIQFEAHGTAVEVRVEKADPEADAVEDIEESSDAMIGQKWSEDEEVKLIDAFMVEKLSIKEIAERHQRKDGGIRSRLRKLRLID